jgi:hypothetical protein
MLGRGASVIPDSGKDTDDEGNLQMPMSTRRFGRTYLMLIQNHINVMVVIDISPQRTLSSSRPM